MKGKSLLLLVFSLLLVLGLGIGAFGLWAKEPAPPNRPMAQSSVGTGFTYQGRLTDGGSPVNGTCDLQFSLHDAASDGTQVGGTQTVSPVTVDNGLFTVELNGGNQFGDTAFTGDTRWLEIAVRCPAGGGSYTPLGPRQELTATPYALSLRPGAQLIGSKEGEAVFSAHNTAATSGNTYGLYGESAASYGGAAVYGLATGEGGTTGVKGESDSSLGTGVSGEAPFFGVWGFASAPSGANYGVYGESGSTSGYGVYGQNTSGGVAIYAGGSGIIKSDAETRLAVNPFEIEPTSLLADNQYLIFLHHWLGYTEIENTSGTGSRNIYVPVHNLTQLFGSPLKLKTLEVCYSVASASSYIDQTRVFYADSTGSRTELMADLTSRASTTWNCYTVSSGSPPIIEGPMLVYLQLYFAGTGDTHKITIGHMVATLVE